MFSYWKRGVRNDRGCGWGQSRFLKLDTIDIWDQIIFCCAVHCRMFSIIPGLHSLDTSISHTHPGTHTCTHGPRSHHHQKMSKMPNVPEGQHHFWLRTTGINEMKIQLTLASLTKQRTQIFIEKGNRILRFYGYIGRKA